MSDALYAGIVADFKQTIDRFGRNYLFAPRSGIGVSTVRGFVRGIRPNELIGGFEQTDQVVTAGSEGFPHMPRKFDRMEINSRPYTVMHANALMAGDTLMGYKIFVRGGV